MSVPKHRFTALQEHFIYNQICGSDEFSSLLSKASGVLARLSWQELSLSFLLLPSNCVWDQEDKSY